MSDQRFDALYPDLETDGGVVNALHHILRSISSPLEVTGGNMARVQKGKRFSQVYTALHQRQFSFDFWDRGVYLGSGNSLNLVDAAKSIHVWIEDRVTMTQLHSTFTFVSPEPIAGPFESNTEVDWKWERLEEAVRTKDHLLYLLPLVIEAKQHTKLRNLFPFTSMYTLCFSRCTGYPYSDDCPAVTHSEKGLFKVFDKRRKLVGQGDAEQAVQLLLAHLPPGSGRAKKGTCDDL